MSCCGGDNGSKASRRAKAAAPSDAETWKIRYPNGVTACVGWDEAESAVAMYGAEIIGEPGMKALPPEEEASNEEENEQAGVTPTPEADAAEAATPTTDVSNDKGKNDE